MLCSCDQLWISHRAIPLNCVPGASLQDWSQLCVPSAPASRRSPVRTLARTGLGRWDRPPIPPDDLRLSSGNGTSRAVLLAPACRRVLLGTLLRNTREQSTNLGLTVTPVPPERTDRRQLPGLRPASDRLRVDTEHRGDLSGGQ